MQDAPSFSLEKSISPAYRWYWPKKYKKDDLHEYNKLTKKPLLFIRNLTKRYYRRPQPAINQININVYPGEFHAFIGANGAGKTTTIKTIVGGYQNWDGTILINGIPVHRPQAKALIGYIPETPRFPNGVTTYSFLYDLMLLSGFKKDHAKKVATQEIKRSGLWKLRNKSPNSFSSGQKKKLLLIQALVHNPKLIVMDEPVANLDPKARLEFFNELMKLKKRGVAIFISSHVLAELEIYFDSVTILDGGKVVFENTKEYIANMDKRLHYIMTTNNNHGFRAILKKHKLRHTITDDGYKVSFKNKEQIKKVLKYLISHNYEPTFTKTQSTLSQLYSSKVVKGSVDSSKEA